MDRTLANFIRALRNSEVRISTAETLDAFSTVELVGYQDREFLKRSLSLVLPKTPEEKETFDLCFEQFFSFKDVHGERESTAESDAEQDDAQGGEGEGGGAGGDENNRKPGQSAGNRKKKRKGPLSAEEEAAEPDLGPGDMSETQSSLGQLLMLNSRVELTVAMASAGEVVDLKEIQVFTQKGLYTRKIMDQIDSIFLLNERK